MNQMPGFLDAMRNKTTFTYDMEGRRTGIGYPFGNPALATAASYDIAGRLMQLITTQGSDQILSLAYGYDMASNRVGMVAGSDTWDYDLDAANRLTHAYLNQFVEQLASHFAMGTTSAAEVDPVTPSVQLVASDDDFSGSALNIDRWRPAYVTADFLGLELRQSDGLLMAFPRGFTDTNNEAEALPGWADPYGLYQGPTYAGVELRGQVGADIDIQVDFSDFQGYEWASTTYSLRVGLYVRDKPLEESATQELLISRQVEPAQAQNYTATVTGTGSGSASATTTDTSGKLRIQRDGATGDVTLSYYSGGAWQTLFTTTWTTADNLYVGLTIWSEYAVGSVRWSNFTVTQPSTQYAASGTYMSSVYDAGRPPTWGTLDWDATTPTGTAVQFQLAASDSPNGSWNFVGPTGSSSYYTTPGTAIPSSGPGAITGRYLRYQATLSGDGTATPVLTRVQVTFSGDNPTTEWDYSYDSAGNLTEVDTITAAGTATEVRDNPSWPAGDQINDLNQILRNDVTPAGGSTTTYRYTYNGDGTLATKTDGTTTWTYNWDPVGTQRLLSVDIGGVTQVAYTYDSLGRMLTRTPYSGGVAGAATSFEWDGMTVVRETTPDGVYRYYAPQGELITFDYTPAGGFTASYSAHADAIGSIRAITDDTGALVAHFEYDAWGTLLPTSDFGPLPGWSYLFVGSLGVRWDAATGLYYMRQRWYDPGLERFVGRDPLGIASSYGYGRNDPPDYVDPLGLKPTGTVPGPGGFPIPYTLGGDTTPPQDPPKIVDYYYHKEGATRIGPSYNPSYNCFGYCLAKTGLTSKRYWVGNPGAVFVHYFKNVDGSPYQAGDVVIFTEPGKHGKPIPMHGMVVFSVDKAGRPIFRSKDGVYGLYQGYWNQVMWHYIGRFRDWTKQWHLRLKGGGTTGCAGGEDGGAQAQASGPVISLTPDLPGALA